MIEKYQDHLVGISQVTFGDGHVGGCNIYGDPGTESPKMWKYLIDKLKIKSVIDVGCGFGFHTKYFYDLGLKTLGVEGSAKVVELSLLPDNVIHHDYTTGPFIPKDTYDLAWSVEFVEHVHEEYVDNFMKTFTKCRYVAMTHGLPEQAGYHHVNCRPACYWISRFKRYDFKLQTELMLDCRTLAKRDCLDYLRWRASSEPKPYRGPAASANDFRKDDEIVPYFSITGMVFKNENLL